MNEDNYLWDRSGPPDPEVERLERLLAPLRHQRPAPEDLPLPVAHFPEPDPARGRPWWAAAAAAAALALGLGAWLLTRPPRQAWEVARLAGAPEVSESRIGETGRLGVGEWLETDAASRARIRVGSIGEVEVEPNTRIRLLEARLVDHRLGLERGKIQATIWAPPRLFYVETPAGLATDLGCRYTLEVDAAGDGELRVQTGWVAFERDGRESFVPAGALCATRAGIGPGTPYFEDAAPAFRGALLALDFGGGERAAALDALLAAARPRDALTLWHLLARVGPGERPRVYDRLAKFAPPPAGVTRAGILASDREMLDLWWDELGLDVTTWWRLWKGPVPAPAGRD